MVQRFGDVKRLISQTLDPILSAYFRDVAQTTCMLDLLVKREEIQRRATEELGRRFRDYDINCIAVLIGRPESQADLKQGPDPIQQLYNQLRARRLAQEQVETFGRQQEAAMKLAQLNEAEATAQKQTELTQTKVNIEISANKGEAQLAEAERLARRDVARARGEAQSRELLGKGEASRIAQTGLAEAAVFLRKIRAYGDSRLFALSNVSEQLSHSQQPLVPQRLMMTGGGNGQATDGTAGLFGQLLALLLAERAGMDMGKATPEEPGELEAYVRQLVAAGQAGEAVQATPAAGAATASVEMPTAATAEAIVDAKEEEGNNHTAV